jgi:hypothetical protein
MSAIASLMELCTTTSGAVAMLRESSSIRFGATVSISGGVSLIKTAGGAAKDKEDASAISNTLLLFLCFSISTRSISGALFVLTTPPASGGGIIIASPPKIARVLTPFLFSSRIPTSSSSSSPFLNFLLPCSLRDDDDDEKFLKLRNDKVLFVRTQRAEAENEDDKTHRRLKLVVLTVEIVKIPTLPLIVMMLARVVTNVRANFCLKFIQNADQRREKKEEKKEVLGSC